jgi:integrase
MDVAVLLLDTGLRVGEALQLQWGDVHLEPAPGSKSGYIQIRDGKSRYAKRNLSLTSRVSAILKRRKEEAKSTSWVFPGKLGKPFVGTSLNHQHQRARAALKLPPDFVIHSLRHTMLTRLGESGADAFTIMRIAWHSSVTISQRYVHPSPESLEKAFERLESLQVQMVGTKMGTAAKLPIQEIGANNLK